MRYEKKKLALYGTAAWQRKRKLQLMAEPLCAFCAKDGLSTPATVADHIIPHKGDAKAFWNNALQSLCKPCHDSTKQRIERGSTITAFDAHGFPVDNAHRFNDDRGGGFDKVRG